MKTKFFGGRKAGLILRGFALGCAALLTTTLDGQIVAWDVSGVNASTSNPLAAGTLDGLLASATLTLGGGLTASATSNTFGGSGFNQTSFAAAISGADYLSFTVTPAAHANFSLHSISLLFGVASAVTNFNVALTSSATGFSTSDALWSFSFGTASPAAQFVTLSAVNALQQMDSAVEFRLFGWRDTAGTSTFRIRDNSGNDLSLAGSVSAIPEPATSATIAGFLGLVAAACHWRRRKPRETRLR